MATVEKSGGGGVKRARRRRWWQLRQRWRMLGVFEIDSAHQFFALTALIKEGVRASVQAALDTPPPETLTAEDFQAEDTQSHQGFVMQTLAAPVFSRLRRRLDITEDQYLNSLCSQGSYLQFISNSKSRADFFLTNDRRFFLKTQSRREIRFLLSNLQKYVQHLETFPHSLMVRFLGVYRIIIPNEMKTYFIVMQSVFYPDERINIRYDIKGCEVGRWTDPDSDGKQVIKVLKDNNFKGQNIVLGGERSWFSRQVEADAAFLRGLNVLDYSLLVAHQPLHRDEQDGKRSFADLVLRTTKSLDFDDSPTDDPPSAPLLAEEPLVGGAAEEPPVGGAAAEPPVGGAAAEGLALRELRENRSDSELQDFQQHHRRLLPSLKNGVHVIDGPERRYFVGIIDVFTQFGCRKKLENLWKRLRFPGREFSTVSPPRYAQRFCRWVQDHSQ